MTWTVHVWLWRYIEGKHRGAWPGMTRHELRHVEKILGARVKLWDQREHPSGEIRDGERVIDIANYYSSWQMRGRRVLYETSDSTLEPEWAGRIFLLTLD